MITGNVIQLSRGIYIDLADPDYGTVEIEDIAHALARLCRYTGHVTFEHYSVAQHSVIASWEAPLGFELEALMHDASEAVLGDVSSPLKNLLPEYRKLEHLHEERIAKRFNLPWPMSDEVRLVDLRMLATERPQLLTETEEPWGILQGVEPYPIHLESWSSMRAEREFLVRYKHLRRKLAKTQGTFVRPSTYSYLSDEAKFKVDSGWYYEK